MGLSSQPPQGPLNSHNHRQGLSFQKILEDIDISVWLPAAKLMQWCMNTWGVGSEKQESLAKCKALIECLEVLVQDGFAPNPCKQLFKLVFYFAALLGGGCVG